MAVNSRACSIGALVASGLIPSLIAWGAATRPPARRAADPEAQSAVATVGPSPIPRAAFEREAAKAVADYRQLRGATPHDALERMIRRQTLERMIRSETLVLEARRHPVPVSEAEVEAEFRTHPFFNVNGRFDASRFAKVKAANSPEYRAALAGIRAQLGARKLARRLEADYAPDPAKLRAEIERSLTRATLEDLALRASEFDGRYAEPRETEILDYYRAHAREFEHVERAELSVIQIGEPAGARGRAVADSLIAAMRGGATFAGAAAGYGGARSKIIVTPDDFPAYWQGDAATRSQVFRSQPGSVLPAAVPGRDGWLVVRVDAVHASGVAPLREVAREIRRRLREQTRSSAQEGSQRALYESRRSMLKSPAYKVRWALIDPEKVQPDEPSVADLESYYRGHLADYSAYDAAAASIRTRPIDEVRDEVRAHWKAERRGQLARLDASRLEQAWRQGRRDRKLEARVGTVHDAGPVPLGAAVDTGLVAGIVTDSLRARDGALGTGITELEDRAILVFHVYQELKDYVPSFEEYRKALEREQEEQRAQDEEAQARAMFERDPGRWVSGRAVHFEEILIPYPEALTVPLTHQEVEHYHVTHYLHQGENWGHLLSTHGHDHNHSEVEHVHIPHKNVENEHRREAHVHDHARPTESPG